MSLTLHTTTLFLTNKNPTTTTTTTIILKSSSSSSSPKFLISKSHLQNYTFLPSVAKTYASLGEPYHQVVSRDETFNFDSSFLSILEFVSLSSSAAISVYIAIYGVQKKGGVGVFGWLGNNILALQSVVLLTAIVVGAAIRRQQWTRICALRFSAAPVSAPAPNLLERVEKLEEDLRSSTTIIRVLSRHLEKLGIRFRLTRKALKEPIQETAALAQKNSEATRALAAQEDILEKELGEIQKVLLAMQDLLHVHLISLLMDELTPITENEEQQQKQLELILAIAKAGKLFETDHVQKKDLNASETTKASADSSVQRQDRNASVDSSKFGIKQS